MEHLSRNEPASARSAGTSAHSDAGVALAVAQSEDREYYHRRGKLLRAVRFRVGLLVGALYGLLVVATTATFGIFISAQNDRWLRGILGLVMYGLGFCWVWVTLCAVRLYHRIWTHYARRMGLEVTHDKASPHESGTRPVEVNS